MRFVSGSTDDQDTGGAVVLVRVGRFPHRSTPKSPLHDAVISDDRESTRVVMQAANMPGKGRLFHDLTQP